MKIKSNIFLITAFLCIFFGTSAAGFAQREQVVGGYRNVSVRDKSVVKAARFAVAQRAKTQRTTINLVAIKNARTQTVAGVNYEICLFTKYRSGKSKKLVDQFVKVVVYRNLRNKYSLTSWSAESCTEQ